MDEDFIPLLEKHISERIHDLMAKSKKSTDPVQSMCLERAAHELMALKDYMDIKRELIRLYSANDEDVEGDLACKIMSYDWAHQDAEELGFESLTEALEAVALIDDLVDVLEDAQEAVGIYGYSTVRGRRVRQHWATELLAKINAALAKANGETKEGD